MRLAWKYLFLPWGAKLTVLQVGVLLIVTRVALLVLPYKMVKGWFERWGSRPGRARGEEYKELLTWAGSGLGRYVLDDKPCLTQALVIQAMMRRAGHSAELRIGVLKDKDDKLTAHAWLESGGRIILGGRRANLRYAQMSPLVDAAP